MSWSPGSNAVFGGPNTAGGAVPLPARRAVNSLIFNSFTGTYTLGTAGQVLTLNGGINKTSSSGAVTISSPITPRCGAELDESFDWFAHRERRCDTTAATP